MKQLLVALAENAISILVTHEDASGQYQESQWFSKPAALNRRQR
jgi:hypothetical protein